MKIFTCTNHQGHYPVGVASVIIAESASHAKTILLSALAERGLSGDHRNELTLTEIDPTVAEAHILRDGNY